MKTFTTTRNIPASPDQIFAAFRDGDRLARWWGPSGFTNTFNVFDFRPGGKWSLVMHGPNGMNYPNESVFAEIQPGKELVIQHLSDPRFVLTITFTPLDAGAKLEWSQAFENDEVAGRIEHIVVPANEQNIDRLTAEVLGKQVN